MAQQKRRASTSSHPLSYDPMYGWALESNGRPVPIGVAERGAQNYLCPICHGGMIAKKGAINQHHFAHENTTSDCTPEAVAQAIAGKWLVLTLGTLMLMNKPAFVNWANNTQVFNANLLEGVTHIVQNLPTDYGVAEIALCTADEDIRAVLTVNPMERLAVQTFAQNGIPIVQLSADRFRSGHVSVDSLFDEAHVEGGWWLVGKPRDLPDLVLDPDIIRRALAEAVYYPPYRFWGPLETMGERQDIVRVGNYLLWLPEAMWTLAIGGGHNKLGEGLDIIIQEWVQPDTSTIVLYYVKLGKKDERAIAIRRFLPKEYVHASLASGFNARSMTAAQIAHSLAMS